MVKTKVEKGKAAKTENAIFAGGCFWHIEDAFRKVKGVIDAISGYSGGTKENPTYEEVHTGKTGHAESVDVIYNPEIVSYDELLKEFWKMIDPTSMNRQGLDFGSQYRSAIFYLNDVQKEKAIASMKEEQKKHSKPIVTEITKAGKFWRAEEYHQHYYEKHKIKIC